MTAEDFLDAPDEPKLTAEAFLDNEPETPAAQPEAPSAAFPHPELVFRGSLHEPGGDVIEERGILPSLRRREFKDAYDQATEPVRRIFSPIIGASEAEKIEQAVPFGKNPDDTPRYQYKPLGSRIDREGGLMTPFIPVPHLEPSPEDGWLTAAGKGAFNTGAGLVGAVESPLSIALPSLSALPAAGKTVAGLFAADMLSHVPGQVTQAVTAPTLQGKIEGGLGAVLGTAMAGLGGAHAAGVTDAVAERASRGEMQGPAGPFALPRPTEEIPAPAAPEQQPVTEPPIAPPPSEPVPEPVTPENTPIAATPGTSTGNPVDPAVAAVTGSPDMGFPISPSPEQEGAAQKFESAGMPVTAGLVRGGLDADLKPEQPVADELARETHDAGGAGTPPAEAAGVSPAAYADRVRAGAAAVKAVRPNRTDFAAEFESLIDRAGEDGFFEHPDLSSPAWRNGQEHEVWLPSDEPGRVLKLTFPNKFGMTLGGDAAAVQYFDRLALQNEVFGDDIRVRGVVNDNGRLRVATTQPAIEGRPATGAEMEDELTRHGFVPIEIDGQPAWYRREGNVLAFDVHPNNFVVTADGRVHPIDTNMARLSGELLARVEQHLPAEEAAITPETGDQPAGDSAQPPANEPPNGGAQTQPSGSPTSIRNAETERLRKEMGLPPAIEPATRGGRAAWDDAMRVLDEDPQASVRLVEELNNKPRATTDTEDMLILHRQIETKTAWEKAKRDAAQAYDDGDYARAEEVRIQEARWKDEALNAMNAGKVAGTATARGLNARKAFADDDYTYLGMELTMRAANGGRPLDGGAPMGPEREELNRQHAKIEQANKAADEHEAAKDEQQANKAANEAVSEIAKEVKAEQAPTAEPKADVPEKPTIGKRIVDRLNQAAEAARQRRQARGGRLNAGIDPAELADAVIIGASHIANGIADFAGWAKTMIGEFGQGIEPHLPQIFKQAEGSVRGHASAETIANRMAARIADGESIADLAPYVRKMAKEFVRQGVSEREPLLDAVHGLVEQAAPGTTRRQTMDLISGYGDFRPLSTGQVEVTLRDLKGQMQQVAKLEDLQQGQPPRRTGVERRTPSREEAALQKQVNELKKRSGIQATDPATQLKSALDGIKTRLKNQIRDLATEIDTGERPPAKSPAPRDAEAESLEAVRDRLKQTLEDIEGKPEMTDEQRIDVASRALENSIAEYERRMRAEEFGPRGKGKQPSTPALEALRARRDASRAEFEELRDLHDEITGQRQARQMDDLQQQVDALEERIREGDTAVQPRGPGNDSPEVKLLKARRDELNKAIAELRRDEKPKKTRAEVALAALKTRLKNRTAELLEKTARGDFSKKQRTPLALDGEAMRLRAAAEEAKLDFDRAAERDRLAKRGAIEKALDTTAKWRRFTALSGWLTLFKLGATAAQIHVIAPLEEAVSLGYSKLPLLNRVAKQARRYAPGALDIEIKAIVETVKNFWSDAKGELNTGKMDIDSVYGRKDLMPHTWLDVFGHIHGALKSSARRNEFTRSYEKSLRSYARQGLDVSDPAVQMRAGMDAYKDAQKSIFTEDSYVSNKVKGFFRAEPVKGTGGTTIPRKAWETTGHVLLPVVRIPTNIVRRTLEYTLGTGAGTARLVRALVKGIDDLAPEEADAIMRNFTRGSIGLAGVAIGFFFPQAVGGYYQKREKRDERDVRPGELRIAGQDVPRFLAHHPLLETLQIGATIRRVADTMNPHDKVKQGVPAGLMAAALGIGEELPFVGQMLHLDKLFGDSKSRGEYFGQLAASVVVPQGVADAAKVSDHAKHWWQGKRRDPHTIGEHMETAIPGLRQHVPLKQSKR